MSKVHTEEDYSKRILEKLWQQCESEDFCDVVLIAGINEKRIPAHRLILSVSSDYFRGMFSPLMLESTKKEIELPSVDGDALQSLVEYCYKGRVIISENIVVEMLKTADMLFLGNVVIACVNFLVEQLHPSNCLGFTLLAEHYHFETLLQNAKGYSLEYFTDVCKTDEFFSSNAEQLRQLLGSDELYVSAEEEAFKSAMQWIEYDPIEREKYKVALLRLVRMPLLERSFLDEHVKPICTSAECFQIYEEAIETQLLSNQKKVTPRNSTRRAMLAITREFEEINIQYYCPQQLKWTEWLKYFEYREIYDVHVTREHVYIFLIPADQHTIGIYLNLRTMTTHQINPTMEYGDCFRAIVLKEFLYVIGGMGKSSCDKWNPKTNSWSNMASMSTERYNFACIIWNEKIYAVGGITKNAVCLNTVECFDPDKNVWTNVASMSTARYGVGVVILNGIVYVIGGVSEKEDLNTAEYFDPDKNVWTAIACMNRQHYFPSVAVLNGLLYVVGGFKGEKIIERYDPKTNNWTMLRGFIEDGFSHVRECLIFRNKVVVCCEGHFEEYDPEPNEWKVTPTSNGITIENILTIFSYSGKLFGTEFFGV